MRHETAWLDRTIHCDSIKMDRMVREATAAVTIEKYGFESHFLSPCRSFNTHHGFSIEHSKEYYYRTHVIANNKNNVALTRCFESCEVWPLKIKLTLLRV